MIKTCHIRCHQYSIHQKWLVFFFNRISDLIIINGISIVSFTLTLQKVHVPLQIHASSQSTPFLSMPLNSPTLMPLNHFIFYTLIWMNPRCEFQGHEEFLCKCQTGYFGDKCEHYNHCLTSPTPCQNGAECLTHSNGFYSCNCLIGFSGQFCEVIKKTQ